MSKKSSKGLKKIFAVLAVISLSCATAGVISACNTESGHEHSYAWKWDGDEHWKACQCGEEEAGSRGEHTFVGGECDCGATETVEEKKYGKAHGQVKLRGLGGEYLNDFSDVTVDMGDDVDPVFDTQTGEFSVENLEAGKIHTLTISKPDYQPYVVSVLVEENDDVEIGGGRGMVLQRNSLDTTLNWGKYNLSKANDETGEISVTNRHFMVLTKDSYDEVAFTLNLNGFKRPGGGVKQGLPLVGDDGQTIEQGIALAFGKDVLSVRMVGKNKIALWNTWLAKEWNGGNALVGAQEKDLYAFEEGDRYLKSFDKNNLALTVLRKENKISVFLNGSPIGEGEVDEKYKDVPCTVGIIAHNAVDDISWKHWNFSVESGKKAVTVTNNTATDAHGTVEGIPSAVKFGDRITLTVTPDTDYKLSALYINGVNVIDDLQGHSYSFVVTKDTTVEAQFAPITSSSVQAAVKGNAFGNVSALAVGTNVKLSQNGFDDIETQLTAKGLEISKIFVGKWTVNIDGYKPVEIDVTDEAYVNEIVFERIPFDKTITWNNYDFDEANKNPGRFGTDSDNFLVLSNEKFGEVAFTMYLNGSSNANTNGEQGISLAFGKQVVTVRMVGKEKLAVWNTWLADTWGGGAIDGIAEKSDLYYFNGEGGAAYLKDFEKGELKLTLYRRGNGIYIYLNDDYIGGTSFDGKYADEKCSVGFVGHSMDKTWKYWNFAVNTEIPDVTVTDGTAQNAGGSIAFDLQKVKIGDTVTITVTPDETHVLENITVTGGADLQRQPNGTYTFVAFEKEYTVTATFVEIPTVEVEASVYGRKYDGTPIDIAGGTTLVFTSASGESVSLTVKDGKVSGILLPGDYKVTAVGYYDTTVTVTEEYKIENGITLEKLVFETNSINHNETYLQGAANSDRDKVVASESGKIYEWSIDEYDDVAVSFTLKRTGSGVQGIVMHFAEGKDVTVRIEQGEKTKVQWMGGTGEDWAWFWGTYPVNDLWDFGNGEDHANPLSAALLAKYNGNEGLKLTLVRRGGTVYALIDGKIYSAQSVGELAGNKVKFALFVENAAAGYEIPFEINTQAYEVLESAGVVLSEDLTGFVGNWTKNDGNLAASGAACYAQFDTVSGVYKESVTMHISGSVGDDQGLIYKFSDGNYMAIRYQYNGGNSKIQYTEDTTLFSKAFLKSWDDFAFNEQEKTDFAEGGLDLTFIRDGNTFYVLLGDRLLNVSTVDEKYAHSGGNMGIMVWNGKNDGFAYSHASGDDVTVPQNS